MKNIAILIWSLGGGGAEKVAGQLSIQLEKFYNVILMVLNPEINVYESGGKIISIAPTAGNTIEENILREKEKNKIDVAISFLDDMNDLNIRTRRKELVIISQHSTLSAVPMFDMDRLSGKWKNYKFADYIVTVSEGIKYDLIHSLDMGEVPVSAIYNYADTDIIRRKMEESPESDIAEFIKDSKVILNVGRLAPQKNQIGLIDQFGKLAEKHREVKLVIVGSGELHEKILEHIQERKLQDKVFLLPYCANPFPYYKMADVFAFSSDFEGLGNVLLEAMAVGLPIVSTDCFAGPRELLDDEWQEYSCVREYKICKRGILVEKIQTDHDDYVKALERLLYDKKLRAEIAENERIYMDEYSNEQKTRQWIDIIENACIRNTFVPSKASLEDIPDTNVIIYGAGKIGKDVYEQLWKHKNIIGFAVSDSDGNPGTINGIKVDVIEHYIEYTETATVVLGLRDIFHEEIYRKLKELGFQKIVRSF
ncbi:N-acetylgalactosamine-N,N'-diacetylbacillosaminyl-diphospho-undecaprenol 4-alpha-N-acetylgalactosaminyltransferase [Lachnospiraceae bacterium]|nr:N-acetylgalactosamine-N,N'-diacetylbacillosaminyl-diphospho-undecaprenol 4-alpha-N-acetylgalactosaminyltransferase [Lachnospiraceae bacterium]